jgi:hypothetical protein
MDRSITWEHDNTSSICIFVSSQQNHTHLPSEEPLRIHYYAAVPSNRLRCPPRRVIEVRVIEVYIACSDDLSFPDWQSRLFMRLTVRHDSTCQASTYHPNPFSFSMDGVRGVTHEMDQVYVDDLYRITLCHPLSAAS